MEHHNFTVDLVARAAAFLRERQRERFTVTIKDDNPRDIVTSIDHAVGEFITNEIKTRYPEHGIYNEEATAIAGNEYTWVIDPVDGTANFARGIPHFGISIGLLHYGRPVTGAVIDPSTGELFHFARELGVFCGNEPIAVSSVHELGRAFVLFAAGRSEHLREWGGESLRRLLGTVNKTKNLGSSALDICYVAAGRIDGCIFGTLTTCDIAAALGILEAAGGVALDANGIPIELSDCAQKVFVGNSYDTAEALRALLES